MLIVAPRYRDDPEMLDFGHEDEYLVRVAEKTADGLVWHDKQMMVEPASGAMIGMEMLPPEPSFAEMRARLGVIAMSQFIQLVLFPSETRIRSEILYNMLLPFSKKLGFKITQVDYLPYLDMMRADLEQFMMG